MVPPGCLRFAALGSLAFFPVVTLGRQGASQPIAAHQNRDALLTHVERRANLAVHLSTEYSPLSSNVASARESSGSCRGAKPAPVRVSLPSSRHRVNGTCRNAHHQRSGRLQRVRLIKAWNVVCEPGFFSSIHVTVRPKRTPCARKPSQKASPGQLVVDRVKSLVLTGKRTYIEP